MSVIYGRKARRSGAALDAALAERGYNGPIINFGLSDAFGDATVINQPEAVAQAVNKRLALQMINEVTPTLLFNHEQGFPSWPIVARPDFHHAGKFLHLCNDFTDVARAFYLRDRQGNPSRGRATHCQRYLADAREFRVHSFRGRCIKLSEKIGGGNHATGGMFQYPHDFDNKQRVRDCAHAATQRLGLDFGAVDLLYRDGVAYTLEVNTAPRLVDENSDTLERYVNAFMDAEEGREDAI